MKTNYIVASYIGSNRHYPNYQDLFKKDPLYFITKHLEFFNNNQHLKSYVDCTFVFNDDVDTELKNKILQLVGNEHEVIFRKNSGFSYGIWNDTVTQNLDKNYNYFFLIEDDYVPADSAFLQHFISRIKNNVAFVCELVEIATHSKFPHSVPFNEEPFRFPSISNGLLSADACRHVLKNNPTLFKINLNNDYWSAYTNQIYFFKNFQELGYDTVDIIDEFCSPYYNGYNDALVYYGEGNPVLIQPIQIVKNV